MTNIQPYIVWIEARLDAARAIPTDDLLIVIAGLCLVLAWRRSARRASSAKLKLAQLETELAAVRATLDAVRRRTVTENWERNQNAPSAIKPVVEVDDSARGEA
jgi:hypothetical protein